MKMETADQLLRACHAELYPRIWDEESINAWECHACYATGPTVDEIEHDPDCLYVELRDYLSRVNERKAHVTRIVNARPMKVFLICPWGLDCRIVATTSQREAAKLLEVSMYLLRKYGMESRNTDHLLVAMASPGRAFKKLRDGPNTGEWVPLAAAPK